MNIKKLAIAIVIISTINLQSISNAYLFGIKSFDDTIYNIEQIKEKYSFDFPIVAFIFDPRSEQVTGTLDTLNQTLGNDKIYHISISPNKYSAKQVAEGKFDQQYSIFFESVKKNNLKVIFRTMHEMNGGRYSRGSDPKGFKKARKHVRNLSREVGLDQKNILFDMSINHRDMPTKGKPSQTAKLIQCRPSNKFETISNKIPISTGYKTKIIKQKVKVKKSRFMSLFSSKTEYKTVEKMIKVPYTIYKTTYKTVQNCYTFEDYYPGDQYVDIIGLTFYNWGKAGYNRLRKSPNQILNDKRRNTLDRIKKINKPIFIDEVGTTAVWYDGKYSQEKSQEVYQNTYDLKNKRLTSLKDFLISNPEILGFIYFNVDYTNGLENWIVGESDRAIINFKKNKFYSNINDLYHNQSFNNKLYNLFHINIPKQKQKTSVSHLPNKGINKYSAISKLLAQKLKKKFGVDKSIKKLDVAFNLTKNTETKKIIIETKKRIRK